jgi:predicted flap endonuclease-1-like 5' DNA nuclease
MEVMAKDRRGGTASNLLDGAALVIVSPVVISALLLGLRPVAKTVIKGGLFVTDQVKQFVTTASEGWSEMIAEARSTAWTTVVPAPTAAPTELLQPTDEAEEDGLQHITGIGEKYAELLREAGVASLRDLARRNPESLHERLVQVNEQQHVVSQVPALELMTDWITQAQNEVR